MGLCWADLSTGETQVACADDATLCEHITRIAPDEVLLSGCVL